MSPNPFSWVDAIVPLVSLFIAAGAFIAARRAESGQARAEETRASMTGMQAESNAFIRAQDIYQSSLQSLEKRNTMLEKKIVLLEAQIAALKKEGNS